MAALDYRSQEAALDKDILLAQSVTPIGVQPPELPSRPTVRSTLRSIFALPATATIDATEDELRVFEKVYCLMATRNPKWFRAAQLSSPLDKNGAERAGVHRLISRLPQPAKSGDRSNPMAEQSDFVERLYACVPEPERIAFDGLLRPINASEGIGTPTPSGLLPVLEAGGWYAIRACQNDIYSIPGSIMREHPVPKGQFTSPEIESRDIADRLVRIEEAMRALPWRQLPPPSDMPRTSLFARLLLRVSINRFVYGEIGIDRLARASAALQGDVLQALVDAGYRSIGDLIRPFQRMDGVDHLAMVNVALRRTIETTGRGVTPGLQRNIDEQANHILASCARSEFAGETLSANLILNAVATKAVAWLLLTQAALTDAKVFNEDPEVHAKQVRVISQRSITETHGQAMMRLRKAVSTVMVTQQLHAISMRRWRQQTEYSLAVRLRCREVLWRTFIAADVHTWRAIFDHFPLLRTLDQYSPVASTDAELA